MAVSVKIIFSIYYISDCFCPLQFFASIYELLNKTLDKNILKKKETKTSYKSKVLLKVVRAKLTGPWEGGGFGGKKTHEIKSMCN